MAGECTRAAGRGQEGVGLEREAGPRSPGEDHILEEAGRIQEAVDRIREAVGLYSLEEGHIPEDL